MRAILETSIVDNTTLLLQERIFLEIHLNILFFTQGKGGHYDNIVNSKTQNSGIITGNLYRLMIDLHPHHNLLSP